MLVQLVQCLFVMFIWLFYMGLMSKKRTNTEPTNISFEPTNGQFEPTF